MHGSVFSLFTFSRWVFFTQGFSDHANHVHSHSFYTHFFSYTTALASFSLEGGNVVFWGLDPIITIHTQHDCIITSLYTHLILQNKPCLFSYWVPRTLNVIHSLAHKLLFSLPISHFFSVNTFSLFLYYVCYQQLLQHHPQQQQCQRA